LKYCSSIFKEALRLYPPAALSNRIITEDMLVNDYFVPKQTTIITSSYVNARHEKFFTNDCYEFKPERFEMKNVSM